MVRVEVPEFRRCCFFVPLRYGLLAWLYAKLILTIIYLILLMIVVAAKDLRIIAVILLPGIFVLIFILVISAGLADVGFSIVFIIGAHKKNHKLMRVYYYFTITMTSLYTLTFLVIIGLQLYLCISFASETSRHADIADLLKMMTSESTAFVCTLVVQVYLILLIRSEILKLKRNCKFKFINNEADASKSYLECPKGYTPTKFLLCLPLRPGLIIWGLLQLIAIAVISLIAVVEFSKKVPYLSGFSLVQAVIFFIIIMIISLLEIINCFFLIIGAKNKNTNFLEVSYHYLKVKVPAYAGLLFLSFLLKLFVHCRTWYYYNLDPWRNMTLLDNQSWGVIDIILQFYLLLLVRSEIIKLEHSIDFSNLYERFRSDPRSVLTLKPHMEAQKDNMWPDEPIKTKLVDDFPGVLSV